MKTLTIKEIRAEKERCQQEIALWLYALEAQTDVKISGVRFLINEGFAGETKISVKIDFERI